MPHEMIITERHGRVGVIKFNRPDRLNALHNTMMGEMRQQVEQWNADPAVGAVVLTGEGRAFCVGADMGGWRRQIERREEGGNGARRERRPAELLDDAIATAAEIAFNPAESLLAIKQLGWQNLSDGDIAEVSGREIQESVAALRRPQFKEAVTAFREKRDPDFHQVEA